MWDAIRDFIQSNAVIVTAISTVLAVATIVLNWLGYFPSDRRRHPTYHQEVTSFCDRETTSYYIPTRAVYFHKKLNLYCIRGLGPIAIEKEDLTKAKQDKLGFIVEDIRPMNSLPNYVVTDHYTP